MYITVHTFLHSQSAAPQSVCQLRFNTAQGSHMTHIKAMHLTFYGLITWHSIHVRYVDRLLAWKLPKHTFSNNCISPTITVCHPLLYHTCCLNAQEQDWKNWQSYDRSLHTMCHIILFCIYCFHRCISIAFRYSTHCTLLVDSL